MPVPVFFYQERTHDCIGCTEFPECRDSFKTTSPNAVRCARCQKLHSTKLRRKSSAKESARRKAARRARVVHPAVASAMREHPGVSIRIQGPLPRSPLEIARKEFYFRVIAESEGREGISFSSTEELIPDMIADAIEDLLFPKSRTRQL